VTATGHVDELTVRVELGDPGVDVEAVKRSLEEAVKLRLTVETVHEGVIPEDRRAVVEAKTLLDAG